MPLQTELNNEGLRALELKWPETLCVSERRTDIVSAVPRYPVRRSLKPPDTAIDVYCAVIHFFFFAQQPNAGQGRLILKVSTSHTMTPQSVGLPCTRDQPVVEAST